MVSSMKIDKSFETDKAASPQIGVTVASVGKYVESDVAMVTADNGVQIVDQDLNLVEVADLFSN